MAEYKLPSPSTEQKTCIDHILSGKNLKIDAVAGSGKTTLILSICKSLQDKYGDDKKVLILTYNASLKNESREKISLLKLDTIAECHSYHAFCTKYYDNECRTDSGIIRTLRNNIFPKFGRRYDLIFLDEQQDMTPVFYHFVKKIVRDKCTPDHQVVVVGDQKQSIYDYAKASSKFLEHADKIFENKNSWIDTKLSTTFRVPENIAKYINDRVLHENRLVPSKSGGGVRVIANKQTIYEDGKSPDKIYNMIKEYFNQGYSAGDIFVLSPSWNSKAKSGIKVRWVDYLSKKGIYVRVKTNDYQSSNDECLNFNKVVFSTFHGTKGLERPIVIIVGFDGFLMTLYRGCNPLVCPNPVYVALTRATKELCLVRVSDDKDPSFVRKEDKYASGFIPTKVAVTKSLNGIDSVNKDRLENTYIKIIAENKFASPDIDLKNIVEFKDPLGCTIYEEVNRYYGSAVGLYLESRMYNRCSIFNNSIEHLGLSDKKLERYILRPNTMTIHELVKLIIRHTNVYEYHSKQISDLDWFQTTEFGELALRYARYIKDYKNVTFECGVHQEINTSNGNVFLGGAIDLIHSTGLIEIKCTTSLETDHRLQLAMYYSMLPPTVREKMKTIALVNLCTGVEQILEVTNPDLFLQDIAEMYTSNKTMTETEFWNYVNMETHELVGDPDYVDLEPEPEYIYDTEFDTSMLLNE